MMLWELSCDLYLFSAFQIFAIFVPLSCRWFFLVIWRRQCWLFSQRIESWIRSVLAAKGLPFLHQEHLVTTSCGCVSVSVYGDEDKPALVTYPDVGLNCKSFPFHSDLNTSSCWLVMPTDACLADMSCFQGLFFCPEAASLLLHNFCIYHITPPGHEVSNARFPSHAIYVGLCGFASLHDLYSGIYSWEQLLSRLICRYHLLMILLIRFQRCLISSGIVSWYLSQYMIILHWAITYLSF